jgi:AraC-like DNA-binding protein
VPRFAVHDGYARYRGPVADSTEHRHAAFQIVVAVRGEVAVLDAAGACHRAAALVVPPMARHRLLAAPDVLTYFVDPRCVWADRLRGCRTITSTVELGSLAEEDLRPAAARTSSALDPRLVAAMATAVVARELPMVDVAARVGLSPQRLRALARRQLGMTLGHWRVWARLRLAAEAMGEGRSLADAALAGGFADQAHLTRWMREMMGLTPTAVLPALRGGPEPG